MLASPAMTAASSSATVRVSTVVATLVLVVTVVSSLVVIGGGCARYCARRRSSAPARWGRRSADRCRRSRRRPRPGSARRAATGRRARRGVRRGHVCSFSEWVEPARGGPVGGQAAIAVYRISAQAAARSEVIQRDTPALSINGMEVAVIGTRTAPWSSRTPAQPCRRRPGPRETCRTISSWIGTRSASSLWGSQSDGAYRWGQADPA